MIQELTLAVDRGIVTNGLSFVSFGSGQSNPFTNTATFERTLIPIDGTFRNLTVSMSSLMGAGRGYDFTLYKNGVVTSMIVSLQGSTSVLSATGVGVTVVAGDEIGLRASAIGAPAATSIKALVEFHPSDTRKFIVSNGSKNIVWSNTGATTFNVISLNNNTGVGLAFSGVENNRKVPIPLSGTLTNFYVKQTASSPSLAGRTYSLYKNGVELPETKGSISTGESTFFASNLGTVVNAGDTITFCIASSIGNPTGTGGTFGLAFIPTEVNRYVYVGTSSIYGATSFSPLVGLNVGNTSEAAVGTRVAQLNPVILSNLWINLSSAPGGTTQRNYLLRRNGVNVMTVSIVGTATKGNNTTVQVPCYENDTLTLATSVVAGVPVAASFVSWGVVATPPAGSRSLPGIGTGI